MKKSRFIEQQIACALRQAESGVSIQEITRKMGITEATFYRWKKKFVAILPWLHFLNLVIAIFCLQC